MDGRDKRRINKKEEIGEKEKEEELDKSINGRKYEKKKRLKRI